MLSQVEQSLLPGDEDVHFYRQHGWWKSPVCLDEDALDDLIFGLERYQAGERDMRLPIDPGTSDTATGVGVLRQCDYISLQVNEFYQFVRRPLLPAMAAMLSGSRTIRLFHDQVLLKPGDAGTGKTTVGWHADKAYWKTCTSTAMLTAWVPLRTCTEAMGPLVFIDGSHTIVGNEDLHNLDNPDMETLIRDLLARGVDAPHEKMTLVKGQVSFHHCLTIHGSYPNVSSTPRAALAIHYQDDTNAYRRHVTTDGRVAVHVNDMLCRADSAGLPDYSDPAICPRLWPPTDHG